MNIYKEIEERMNGEIYIGVVGPVRTGKSTFIKRFMEQLVIPNMKDEYAKTRAKDEMPLSADGKMVTTTEPKFIPKDEAVISIGDDVDLSIRLIDCVGFMVNGATTGDESSLERMVKTPWFSEEIPFAKAAEIGTRKVIEEHAGIGIVITTDGTTGSIARENYLEAEEKTINELNKHDKPFLILLNTKNPYSDEARNLADEMSHTYNRKVIPVNCMQLRKDDIHKILEEILYEFPLSKLEIFMPKWVEMLDKSHPLKENVIAYAKDLMSKISTIRNVNKNNIEYESEYIKQINIENINLANGCVKIRIDVDDAYYYEMLSEMTGMSIKCEYDLLSNIKKLAIMKKEYEKVEDAIKSVKAKGYGVVTPTKEDITLEEPVIIHHGNKYGVKIKAVSPSVHFIKANIETEIAPIVGNEQQAEDLIAYIKENSKSEEGIWDTNIFGKSIEQLVEDGIRNKISIMGDESQLKLQDTMQKIVNNSNGGLVCIII